jgi:hypothetical protein
MSSSNSNDPSGFVTNPPSTIVKVVGTAREDVNGSVGVVVQFQTDRCRYLVHLAKTQNIVAMKPENLMKASYMDKAQFYYEQIMKDPQVQRVLARVRERLPHGVTLQQVGIGCAVMALALIYFLGFSRTIMLVSFSLLVLMIIGPDLVQGAPMQTVIRNAPPRFQTMIRDQFPGGKYIADKPYLLMGLAAFMFVFFVKSMITSPASATSRFASKAAAGGGMMPPSRKLMKTPEEYYKLGFDDAMAQKEFGTSLPAEEEPPISPTTSDDLANNVDYGDDPLYPMPPMHPQPSVASKFFSFGNAMSILYLGRTAMELGRQADGSWSFPMMKQNLLTLEPWRLGLLGLSVYRLVQIFL